ncbi:MAG: hypothetical protein AAGD96_07470 [Chloroflexota bacterium]
MSTTTNITNIETRGGNNFQGDVDVGDDFVAGDQNITINQVIENEELTNEPTISAYLEAASTKQLPPPNSPAAIKRLWDAGFYAHQSGETSINPSPIWRLVRNRFEFAQNNELPQTLLLMANAGMGKTGALKILTNARAALTNNNLKRSKTASQNNNNEDGRGMLTASRTFIIPIFLDLEELLNSDLSMNDLVSDAFNSQLPRDLGEGQIRDLITKREVERFLGRYTCMFLIDNMDLLITKSDQYLIKMVRQFVQLNRRHQFVITCRPTNYRNQLGNYDRIYLNELSKDQVDDILANDDKLSKLRRPIRQLARNRSHMAMIIRTPTGRHADGYPPLSKGHLVQFAERKRLDESFSNDRENGQIIDVEVAEEVLQRLAYEMSKNHKGTCSDEQAKWLVKQFLDEWDEPYTWRSVMNDLRRAGLIKRAGRRDWMFVRRKTEAYFAAAALAEDLNSIDRTLDQLVLPRGNETLEILTGLLKKPGHLLDKLLEADHVFTAVHCGQFASVDLKKSTLDNMFEALMKRMEGEHAARRAQIALQLGESGHEAAIRPLIHLLVKERSSLVVKSIALAIWVCINQNDTEHFDNVLHQTVMSLRPIGDLEGINLPDLDNLLDVLHVFDRQGPHHSTLSKKYKKLIKFINSPKEHRLVRGLAGFGLGFLADGNLLSAPDSNMTEKQRERLLDLTNDAREKLLYFVEHAYDMQASGDQFVSWCCTDALTQIDHNSVLTTAMRLCQEKSDYSTEDAEVRAQSVYIMGVLGRRTAHKHATTALYIYELLNEEPSAHNVRAHGYAAQAVSRLWIDDREPSDQSNVLTDEQVLNGGSSDEDLRNYAAVTLVKCRDILEVMMSESHHSWLRRKISEALGDIGTNKALELLHRQVRLERSRTRTLEEAIRRLDERLDL